jgi:hypothetical protein
MDATSPLVSHACRDGATQHAGAAKENQSTDPPHIDRCSWARTVRAAVCAGRQVQRGARACEGMSCGRSIEGRGRGRAKGRAIAALLESF